MDRSEELEWRAPKKFPAYMVQESDNLRGEISRLILSNKRKFTFEDGSRAAFDTYVPGADHHLPTVLVAVRNRLDSAGPSGGNLPAAFGVLSAWDRRSTTTSVAMTLFVLTLNTAGQSGMHNEAVVADAFANVIAGLEKDFGTWRIGGGEISRLQRYGESKDETFSDNRTSVAVPGMGGREGGVFTFHAAPMKGLKRRDGIAGGTYVSVVEFGPKVRGMSVHVFGSSGDPENKHFMDQSSLYARGEFKPAWLALEDIKANLENSYRPGEEKPH